MASLRFPSSSNRCHSLQNAYFYLSLFLLVLRIVHCEFHASSHSKISLVACLSSMELKWLVVGCWFVETSYKFLHFDSPIHSNWRIRFEPCCNFIIDCPKIPLQGKCTEDEEKIGEKLMQNIWFGIFSLCFPGTENWEAHTDNLPILSKFHIAIKCIIFCGYWRHNVPHIQNVCHFCAYRTAMETVFRLARFYHCCCCVMVRIQFLQNHVS